MSRDIFWYISQFGILLESFGALWIVYSAYKGMKDQEDSEVNYAHSDLSEQTNGRYPQEIITTTFDVISSTFRENSKKQFKNELYGFTALAVGLFLQFIGGF